MVAYLSDDWLDRLERALGTVGAPAGAAPIQVEYQITGWPEGGERRYHLALRPPADGPSRVVAGPAPQPAVVFRQDYQTALDVAGGRLAPHAALLAGDIGVQGDPTRLLAWRDMLARAGALASEAGGEG